MGPPNWTIGDLLLCRRHSWLLCIVVCLLPAAIIISLMSTPQKGVQWCLMNPARSGISGLSFGSLLSWFSACSSCSFCLVIFLLIVHSPPFSLSWKLEDYSLRVRAFCCWYGSCWAARWWLAGGMCSLLPFGTGICHCAFIYHVF